MLKLLNQERFDKLRDEFAKWNKSDGKENKGLTDRRDKEADLFEGCRDMHKSLYSHYAPVPVLHVTVLVLVVEKLSEMSTGAFTF